VIIGFGSAGYSSLMTIKRENPRAEVVIVDPKDYDLMHSCGLPYSIEGLIDEGELYQDIHLNRMGVEKIKAIVEEIDVKKNIIRAVIGDEEVEITYDFAIIATGSKPLIPQIKGMNNVYNKGLYSLTSIEDLKNIKAGLDKKGAGIVIGAGSIGLETAIALKRYLERIVVFEVREHVLPGIVDPDISKTVEEYLISKGIDLRLNSRVIEVKGENFFEEIITEDGIIEAGIGILATGFKANTDLAQKSGIEFEDNGIIVDSCLKTSIDNIYAAGDCISGWSVIDNRKIPAKLATSAYKQGRIAGLNVSGKEERYRGSTGSFVTKIGDLEVAGVGYNSDTSKNNKFVPISGKIKMNILPDYFPSNSKIFIKVILDKKTGKILGAEAVGKYGVVERINLISMAIEFNISVGDLARVELAYCPAVGDVYDPLHRSIDFAIRKIKK